MKRYICLIVFSLFTVIGAKADVLDLQENAPAGGQAAKMSQDFNFKRQNQPKILLLVSERINNEPKYKAWWVSDPVFSRAEDALKKQLNMFGYKVVEPFQAAGFISKNYSRMDIGGPQAIDIAKQFGAEYVIIGEAVVRGPEKTFEASNNRVYTATLKTRLLSAKDSRFSKDILSSGNMIDPQVYTGMSRALENAARETALIAIDDIKEKQPN
jgi:hypothetical protein